MGCEWLGFQNGNVDVHTTLDFSFLEESVGIKWNYIGFETATNEPEAEYQRLTINGNSI